MAIETKIFFENRNKELDNYVINVIKNPDKGSEFEKKMKNFIHLPKSILIANLKNFREMGYDMMMGYSQNEIIGFMAYQDHKENGETYRKMFRCYIEPEKRNRGYAHELTENLVQYSIRDSIDKIRLGKETNKENFSEEELKMKALLRNLKKKGFDADLKTHWVDLKKISQDIKVF